MNSNQAYINQACKIFIVCCHHIKVRTQNGMVENTEQYGCEHRTIWLRTQNGMVDNTEWYG